MFRRLAHPVFCVVLVLFFSASSNEALAQPNTIHGNAINLGAGCYRLTNSGNSQRGAVWYGGTVDISQSWEMTADVYLGTSNGGADGMTFVLRDPDASVLGGAGGLMGYGGNFASPAIEPSVSVQIDTYQGDNHNDPWYDHLAIMADGNVTHGNANALAGPITAHPGFVDIENGIEHQLRVTFDANSQVMTVYWDCVERLSEVIDLEGIIGTNEVKWGFTAATGGLNNVHRVCNAEWIEVEDVVAPLAITCPGEPIELTLSDYALNPIWSPSVGLSDDNGNSVTATLVESQTYTVTYEDVCEETYTIDVFVEVPELPETGLPEDTIACDASNLVLPNGPWPAGITGTWNDGSTDENYVVSGTGSYTLTLEESTNGCTVSSTVDVVAVVLPDLTLGPDQTTCPGELVSFDLSGADPALSFTWNGIPGDALFVIEQPGSVIVEWNISICSASDEVIITNHPLYEIEWEEDPVVLCLDETESISAVDLNWTGETVSYSWSTASDESAIEVNEPGLYTVNITTDDCAFNYEIEAVDSPNQGVNLGDDVLLCDDDFVTFESGYAAANTLWVTGGSASGMNATSTTVQGTETAVIAQVTIGACIERDTAYVDHIPFFDGGLPSSLDLCLNDSLLLEAAIGAEAYNWNNGPTDPTQWVNEPGTYSLEMEIGGCTFTDDVLVSQSPNQGVDLGADLVTCEDEVTTLMSGYTAAETLWWENGSNQGNAASWSVLNDDAVIIAQVTVGACVERDTISIDYAPPFNTGLPSSLPLCAGDSLWLVSNVGAPEYAWNNGASSAGIWIYAPGNYTLTTPIQGCQYETTVAIQNIPLPVFDLGMNETICEGESILMSTGLFTADETEWSTGTFGPTLEISEGGTYTAIVTENGCSNEDEVTIFVQDLPVFDLGSDQALCPDEDAVLYIYPFPEGATASWSTGSSETAIITNSPGLYSALVNWNGCIWTDEVLVERAAPILIDIVEPLTLCEGESMIVSAENPPNLFPIGYNWSNGETTPAIQITRQGFYDVIATNACDTVTKSFEVKLEFCECPVYVPNAFTPDNDGTNDLFIPILGCQPDSYRLEIFNTWGELIFATEDPMTGWYGQVEENPESTDHSGYFTRANVYHWRVEVAFVDENNSLDLVEQTFEGHVHLMR